MTLWLIRSEISTRDLMRWIGARQILDTDRAMHCLLTEIFGVEDSPKPYRAVLPRKAPGGTLYAYTSTPLSRLLDNHRLYADPMQARILPLDSFEDKEMAEALWVEGRTMGFEARVRPVRQRRWPNGGKSELDAFACYQLNYPGVDVPRERVYAEWLSERFGDGGAALDMESVQMASYRECRMHRQRRGPDAVMRGNLTIIDAHAFRDLIVRGLGRHKTFGYGMVLPRPVMVSGR